MPAWQERPENVLLFISSNECTISSPAWGAGGTPYRSQSSNTTPVPQGSGSAGAAECPAKPETEAVTGALGAPDIRAALNPIHLGAGGLFQRSRTSTAPAEDLSLTPSTHIGQLTIVCNRPRGSNTLFCAPPHTSSHLHAPTLKYKFELHLHTQY